LGNVSTVEPPVWRRRETVLVAVAGLVGAVPLLTVEYGARRHALQAAAMPDDDSLYRGDCPVP